ncbi:MAG: hypothetical protein JW940_15800 [Polyangiaceae bacterium]|nr:hypothetical protein [Polyangiaceae bacterium]
MAKSQRALRRLGRLALVASFALLGGCALDTDRRPEGRTNVELSAQDGTEQASAETPDSSTCTDGVVEECLIRLPTHEGVQTCFHGLKLCKEGQWTACGSADDIEQQLQDED